MYYRGNRHEVTIGGKTFWVDSNQEETLLRWLESHGFSGRWRRLGDGLSVGGSNYTPDLELSIQLGGMTHRALVESKPTKAAFTPDVSRRMRGVARHYFTEVLLLYVHDEKQWYRADIKTGELSEFGVPTPGDLPVDKLYKPMTLSGRRVYSHSYRERLDVKVGKTVARTVANSLESGLKAMFGPKKTRRRPRKGRRTS